MIGHELHDIKEVQVIGPHQLRLRFEDGVIREVDLSDITAGQMYGPLRDPDFFARVRLNPEIETIEWPNGADFDPETLYYWDQYQPAWKKAAEDWGKREQAQIA
jgi:hypothetical protein